jgi:serine/threonine-protein kinase
MERGVLLWARMDDPTSVVTNGETKDEADPRPGVVIGGRYLIERALGVGGMGAVMAARDLVEGGIVAIKFLLRCHRDEEQVAVRFEREARATERLRSPHVRRVLGTGTTPGGARYMVMEYLEGEDLQALVRREGPLDPRRAAEYVTQACRALAEAHALGIVHRDLKPANLFLARKPDGSSMIKVVDFGVAKFESPNVAGDARDMTASGLVLGSRRYMAPEQVLDPRRVDNLADVWALGAILYFLLAGRVPFDAPNPEEALLDMLHQDPPSLLALRPELPPRLVEVIGRCMQRSRGKRYPNVVELIRALAPFTREDEEIPRSVRVYLLRTQDLGDVKIPPPPPVPAPEPPPPPIARPRKRATAASGIGKQLFATVLAFTVGGITALPVAAMLFRRPAPAPAAVTDIFPPTPDPAPPAATASASAATTAAPTAAPSAAPVTTSIATAAPPAAPPRRPATAASASAPHAPEPPPPPARAAHRVFDYD